jgi:hypothetical protein
MLRSFSRINSEASESCADAPANRSQLFATVSQTVPLGSRSAANVCRRSGPK